MRVPSSLGGAQPRQAYAVLIRGRIGYFHTDEAARETELHSTATDGSPTSQVKPGITARWWAFMEEGLQEGKRPTVRRAEQVTRSEGARVTFGAKLDGLTTRNTAASRT